MKIFSTTKQMRRVSLAVAAIAVAGFAFAGSANARDVSDAVKVACSGDYSRLCDGHEVGSKKLDSCMRTNGKRLSRVCADALHREGHMTRGEYSKWRETNGQ